MVGIDYSPKAVKLARGIAAERKLAEAVKFYISDCIMDDLTSAEWVPGVGEERGFDVVLDKGTFDAISLSGELLGDGSGRRIYEGYAENIVGVMKKGGLLVVTSCNWTGEELKTKLLVTEGYGLSSLLAGNNTNRVWAQVWSITEGYHIPRSHLVGCKDRLSPQYVSVGSRL